MNKSYEVWQSFLNPEELRSKLIIASIFITAFEILKTSIIDRITVFFSKGFDENGLLIDDKYKKEVLSRNNSTLYASIDWLMDATIIDDEDLAKFKAIRTYRNKIAHETLSFITKGITDEFVSVFSDMITLLDKIETWWIVNVEIATGEDLAGKDFDENGVLPGSIMMLKLLLDIALGAKEDSEYYFREFKKHTDN